MNLENWDFDDIDNDLVFEFSIDIFSEIKYNTTIIFRDDNSFYSRKHI